MKKVALFIFLGLFLLPVSAFAITINPISFPVGCLLESNPTCSVDITCDTELNHFVVIFDNAGSNLHNCQCGADTQDCKDSMGYYTEAGNYYLVEMYWEEGSSEVCFTNNLADCRLDSGYIGETNFSMTEAGGEEEHLFSIPDNMATSVFGFSTETMKGLEQVLFILSGLSLASGVVVFVIEFFGKK